jgi:hypothetical protein
VCPHYHLRDPADRLAAKRYKSNSHSTETTVVTVTVPNAQKDYYHVYSPIPGDTVFRISSDLTLLRTAEGTMPTEMESTCL